MTSSKKVNSDLGATKNIILTQDKYYSGSNIKEL